MKLTLLFTGVITLLAATGCIVTEGGGHRHAHYERHAAVIVGPPVIVVRPPIVVVPAVRVQEERY